MGDDSTLSTLVSSAALILVGGVFSASGSLVERVIIGRMLSPTAYGEVSLGLTIFTLSTTVALLGFSQGVPRYMPRFETIEKKRGVWITGLLIPVGMGVVLGALLFLNAEFIAEQFFEQADAPRLIRTFAVALPFITGLKIGIGGIRGMENTIYRTYTKDILYPALRVVMITVFLVSGYEILSAGYGYLIAAVVTFILAHLLLNRLIPLIGSFDLRVRELLNFSLPLVIGTLLGALLLKTDTVMLGYFRSSFEVGQYSAAYPLGRGMLILLTSFGFMYLPLASSLDADGKREQIDEIYATTTKWVFIGTFPAFVVMTYFSEDLLRIFFGAEYTPGGIALTILAIGFFSNAIGGRNRETLSAIGQSKQVLIANGLAFGLNLALNLVLIPRYGYVGAAVSSAVSIVLLNGYVCGLLYFKFDISPFSRWSVRVFGGLPLLLLPPLYLVSQHLTLTGVTLLPFLIVVEIAAIAAVAITGGFQPDDRILIEFVESRTGITVPYVDRYLPSE